MNNGCKKRLIPVYFIGIILGFILAETEKNINQNIEQATFGAGCFFLFFSMIEYCRAVLGTGISALPVQCSGVMGFPENIQQIFVAD